jgi:hypothetical protein
LTRGGKGLVCRQDAVTQCEENRRVTDLRYVNASEIIGESQKTAHDAALFPGSRAFETVLVALVSPSSRKSAKCAGKKLARIFLIDTGDLPESAYLQNCGANDALFWVHDAAISSMVTRKFAGTVSIGAVDFSSRLTSFVKIVSDAKQNP